MLQIEVDVNYSFLDLLTVGLSVGTFILFAIILAYTRKSADAAVEANRRAREEMDIRLSPFVSITGIKPYAVRDDSGKIIQTLNRDHGLQDLDDSKSDDEKVFVLYEATIENHGTLPALSMGIAEGKGLDRQVALTEMRYNTSHNESLIPPNSSSRIVIEVPLEDVRRFRAEGGDPYFVSIEPVP